MRIPSARSYRRRPVFIMYFLPPRLGGERECTPRSLFSDCTRLCYLLVLDSGIAHTSILSAVFQPLFLCAPDECVIGASWKNVLAVCISTYCVVHTCDAPSSQVFWLLLFFVLE